MKRRRRQMKRSGRVLVVSQDGGALGRLPVVLTTEGYSIVTAQTGETAMVEARRGPFDIALIDEELPDIEPTDLAASLKELHPKISITLATAGASADGAKLRENDRMVGCLAKLVDADEVLATTGESLSSGRSAAEVETLGRETRRELEERGREEEAWRTSEARYRSLAETAGAGIGIADLNGVFVFVNKALCRMLGYSRQALLGRHFVDFLHPDDREGMVRAFLKGLEGQRSHPLLEFRVIRGDGRAVWLCSSPTALTHENKTIGFSAILHDITERKEVEEALRRSEEKYRNLVEEIRDGYLVVRGSRILLANRIISEALGRSVAEVTGASFLQYLTPESRAKSRQIYERTKRGEPPPDIEYFELQLADGSTTPVEMRFEEIAYEGEKAYSILLRNISERKRAEEALQESERRYRLLAENATDVIWTTDLELRFTYVSPSITRLLGCTVEEAMALTPPQLFAPSSLRLAVDVLAEEKAVDRQKERDPSRSRTLELELRRRDGSTVWTEVTVTFLRDTAGEATAILGIARDITERRQAQAALEDSERKYRSLVERANDGILIIEDGVVKFSNERLADMGGYAVDELVGRPFADFLHPDEVAKVVDRYRRRIAGEDVPTLYATVLKRKDGIDVYAEVNAGTFQHEGRTADFVFVRDITERRKAEEALRQSEEKYRHLIEEMQDGYLVVRGSRVLLANRVISRVLGLSAEEITSTSLLHLLSPESRDKSRQVNEQTKRGEPPPDIECFELQLDDGSTMPVEMRFKEIAYEGEKAYSIVVRDITERRQAEEEIRRHTRRVEALHAIGQTVSQTLDLNELLDKALAGVLEVTDADAGGIYLLEPEGGELVLGAYQGMSQEFARSVLAIAVGDEGLRQGLMSEGFALALDEVLERARTVADAGDNVAERLRASMGVSFWSKGMPQGVLVVARRTPTAFTKEESELLRAAGSEIGVGVENARLLERMTKLSVTDELTGLFNRRHFYEALEAEMSRTRRYGRGFSLVMLDLDGFKEYNDRFGHISGDALLRSLADTLRLSLRKSDMGFRYSGDKFTIVLPGADSAKAARIVGRIRSAWPRCWEPEGAALDVPLGFSAGIAGFPADAGTADGLVFLADTAVFHSRRQGGYRTTLVSELGTVTADAVDHAVLDHVYALAATVDARDTHTYGHSERVAAMSERIGAAVGLPSEELMNLHAAALLHDIGKIGVPDSILTKPDKLTEEERRTIEKHAAEGARIVGHIRELAALVPMVRHHHEWYNGAGYPEGLKGDDIPLGARIVAIADAYDTMTTTRHYRVRISREEAIGELRRCAGSQFDPDLVGVFANMLPDSPARNGVRTSG